MSCLDAKRGGTSAGGGGADACVAGAAVGLGAFGGFSVRGRLAAPPSMLMRGSARSFRTFSLDSFGFGSFGFRGSAMLFSRPRTVPAEPWRGGTKRATHSSVLGKLIGPIWRVTRAMHSISCAGACCSFLRPFFGVSDSSPLFSSSLSLPAAPVFWSVSFSFSFPFFFFFSFVLGPWYSALGRGWGGGAGVGKMNSFFPLGRRRGRLCAGTGGCVKMSGRRCRMWWCLVWRIEYWRTRLGSAG